MTWTPRRVEDDLIDAGNMHWRDGEDDGLLPAGLLAAFSLRPGTFRSINAASTSEPKGAPAPAPAPAEEKPADPPPADPPKDTEGAAQAGAGAAAVQDPPPAEAPKPSPAAADNVDAKKAEPAPEPAPEAPKADAPPADAPKDDAPSADAPPADAPPADAPKDDAPKADAPRQSPAAADNADTKRAEPAPADAKPATGAGGDKVVAADGDDAKPGVTNALYTPASGKDTIVSDDPNATQTKPGSTPVAGAKVGAGLGGDQLAGADETASQALDLARTDAARTFLASDKDSGTDGAADADADKAATDKAADQKVADQEALRARNQVDAAKTPGAEPSPEPITTDSANATELDQLTPEQRQAAIEQQKSAGVEPQDTPPPPTDADEKAQADYDAQVKEQADAQAQANEAYWNQQGNNVYVDPATGTVYQATYTNGQVVKTRLDEPVPVGEAPGSRDTTIVTPDAGGETYTTEVTPPANADGTTPPPIKATIETAPTGDVEKAWVEGADDDAAKLDAVLPEDRRQQVADAQPPLDASKEERSAWYDQVNVNVDPTTGKVSGAGLNHGTGELTLNRNADKVETAPGVFASRDTSTKVDLVGTKALTGTTTALDPSGAKVGDPIRDEITTKADGTITKSTVSVLGEDGQPKKDDKGNPVPPSAQQLDTVAPETKAAVAEAQRLHTEKVDALRGELPNPSTEEQRKAYTDNIAKNDAAIQAELKRYYASTNLYVLPNTGEVYNASHDEKSGELHLQRPGLRTDFQGGATENHQFYIEPNGARREVRGIQVDGTDGKPGPAPIEFSTERTFSGELKGAHLTQADKDGTQQKLNDGVMLDELVTPDLKQELVGTQQRDDAAVTQLRETAKGTGPEADAAKSRIEQLMDERGIHVDYDGTAYSSRWDQKTGEVDLSRTDMPKGSPDQPATQVTTNAKLRTDGTRRTETEASTVPTGKPGEVVQFQREIVETDPKLKITSSQVVEGQRTKNVDGTEQVDESTTDFDAEGKPSQTVRREGVRGGEGPKDQNGFLTSKDRSTNTVEFNADGTPKIAKSRTDYGRANEDEPERYDETQTDFWQGGQLPKSTTTTATTKRKVGDDDNETAIDTTKTTTGFGEDGIPQSTYVERAVGKDDEKTLSPRELTVWNADGTVKTRVAGGDATTLTQLQAKADKPDTTNLLQGDQLKGVTGSDVRTVDPKTPIPDGHGLPAGWKRGDDGRWDPTADTRPDLAPPLKAGFETKGAFEMSQELRAAATASTLDANGPHPGTPEFDQLLGAQDDYQARMNAAPDDAARKRIQSEYFDSHDVWVEPGEDGQQPVLMAASYSQGIPDSKMFGSERAKQPHAVLARAGIAGQDEDGNATTTDALARLYSDNTRDDVYETRTTVPGSPPSRTVIAEHRNGTGRLERQQTTTEGQTSRAAEGKPPINSKRTTDIEFDPTVNDPESGAPAIKNRKDAQATWDDQTSSINERSDVFADGKLVDTKITETQQSRDYDQSRVDDFDKQQHEAMYDASHGNFNTGDHTDMQLPPVGSNRTTRSTDIDYDPNGVAIYSESKQSDVFVQNNTDNEGKPDNGVLVISSDQTTKYGTKNGTKPIFDDEGNPVVEGTFEKSLKTSEFDPDAGFAGGNTGADFQARTMTEVQSSGKLGTDGTPKDVRYTPTVSESVMEGHDDDAIYKRAVYHTDPKTGGMLIDSEGRPDQVDHGDKVFDAHGNEHVLGDGNAFDMPRGSNPDDWDWDAGSGAFGDREHKTQDFADDFEDNWDAWGGKVAMVGGIAIAVAGVVAAPFSAGASLALVAGGIALASADFGRQALNYRQGEIDGGDLAWSGAGVALSAIPGGKLLSVGAKAAKAGNAALRGGTVAASSTSRAATSTIGRAATRAGQSVDNAVNARLTSAYKAHPGLTNTLARADKYLPNWAMGNTGQLLTNSPLMIHGAQQLNESVARDGWTFDNVLAATSVGLGLAAPAASAGHLRLYRNPASTSTTIAPRTTNANSPTHPDPTISGTADPNVFAPGRGPNLRPAPNGPDGVPLVTDAQPPRTATTDGPAPRPAIDAAPTDATSIAGARGGGADGPAVARTTTTTRPTQQHATELQQTVLPRLAAGNPDVAARTFTGPDGVARVAIADRSTNQIYVLRDGVLEGIVPFDSPEGTTIAAATRAGQALPAAQVRELAAAPPRLALEAAGQPARATSTPSDADAALLQHIRASDQRQGVVDVLRGSGQLDNAVGDLQAVGLGRNGRPWFLDNGNSRRGMQHIVEEHGAQFRQAGISDGELPRYLTTALETGTPIGLQGNDRVVYEFPWNGQTRRVAFTVSDRGFIVGANPKGTSNKSSKGIRPFPADHPLNPNAALRGGTPRPAAAYTDTVDGPRELAPSTPARTTRTDTAEPVVDATVPPRSSYVEATPRSTQLEGAAGFALENGTPRNLTLHRDIEGGGAYLLDSISGLRLPATPQALRNLQLGHRSSLPVGGDVTFQRNGAQLRGSVVEHRADGSTLVRGADGTEQAIATHDLFEQNLGGILAGRTFTSRSSVLDPSVALPIGAKVRLIPDAVAQRFGLAQEQFTVVGHRPNGEVVVRGADGSDQVVVGDGLVDTNVAQVLAGRTFTANDGSTVRINSGDGTNLDVSVTRNGVATNERWTAEQLRERVPALREPVDGTVSVLGHDGRTIRVADSRGGTTRTYDVDASEFAALVPDHAAQMLAPRVRYDNQTAVMGVRGLDGRAVDPVAIADARNGRNFLQRGFDPYASDLMPNPNPRLRGTVDEFGRARAGVNPTYRVPRAGYVDAMPRAGSIEQGNLGDCFLLASLNEHIARNPEAASSMVTQRADGNIAVRLGNQTIVVSPELPHVRGNLVFNNRVAFANGAGGGRNRALMAAYVEKAIAATSPQGYQALQGGDMHVATAFLRGETPIARHTASADDFVGSFAREMQAPTAFEHTIGTFGAFGTDPRLLTPAARERIARVQAAGLVPGHAYSVSNYRPQADGSALVDLHNPWGRDHATVNVRDLADLATAFTAGSTGVYAPPRADMFQPSFAASGADNLGSFRLTGSSTAGRQVAPFAAGDRVPVTS